MDGTHLNTSQLVCGLRWKVYLGTKLHFRPDHSQDVQLHALSPPYVLLPWSRALIVTILGWLAARSECAHARLRIEERAPCVPPHRKSATLRLRPYAAV